MYEFLFPIPKKPPNNTYFAPCPNCKSKELMVAHNLVQCSNCGNTAYFVSKSDRICLGNLLPEELNETADAWNRFIETTKDTK